MKRIVLPLLLATALSLPSYAVGTPDKEAMGQYLTNYVKSTASVGKISIKEVKINGNVVDIYASHQLGTMSLTPAQIDTIYSQMSKMALGNEDGTVHIWVDDEKPQNHELSELVTALHSNAPYKHYTLPKVQPLTVNSSRPYTVSAGLEGQHIALYGSHGIYYLQKQDNWTYQRAKLLTTVEDIYTTSYTMPFLTPMLENAGAVVLQPRERDTQLNEVIVDNGEANMEGQWTTSEKDGWGAPNGPLLGDDNPFVMGGYAYVSAEGTTTGRGRKAVKTEAASITYRPEITEEGEYAVYISYKTLSNSTSKAQYSVCHKGTVTEFTVNQQMGSSTWIYLGTFAFGKDKESNYVRLSNKGEKGETISSDAVKFGGGWGSVARYPVGDAIDNVPSGKENGKKEEVKKRGPLSEKEREMAEEIACTSGYPRWMEGARYWFQYSGVPESVYNYTDSKNDYIDDYASRGRWMNWLAGGSAVNPKESGLKIPVTMGLAFHTDAGVRPGDGIIGTLMIYTDWDNNKDTIYPTGVNRLRARDLGDYMQTQITEDIRKQFAPEWNRRQLNNSSYAESRHPKMPVVLLELLSHQNFADMKYGLDPRFRFAVSRSIYKGMLRFLHEQYGTAYVVQPLPVKDFATQFEGEQVRLSWTEVRDSIEETATPDYYIVYTRTDEGDWDNGQKVSETSMLVSIEADKRYDWKVVAGNKGGISFPSEVLSAYKSSKEKGRVLVINGFTRICGPEAFSKDSTSGMAMNSDGYAVPYIKDVCYIGEQYDYFRGNGWKSDDNAGFGASYADKAKEVEIGNTMDYPVMHGRMLAEMSYSYTSCATSAIDTVIPEGYDAVDLILGKQKETQLGTQKVITDFKTFSPNMQKALSSYTGRLLCSGAFVASDMQQSSEEKSFIGQVLHIGLNKHQKAHSGMVNFNQRVARVSAQVETEINAKVLPAESIDILSARNEGKLAARYEDSGLGAGVYYEGKGARTLVFGFPLESMAEFDDVYKAAVKWLFKK